MQTTNEIFFSLFDHQGSNNWIITRNVHIEYCSTFEKLPIETLSEEFHQIVLKKATLEIWNNRVSDARDGTGKLSKTRKKQNLTENYKLSIETFCLYFMPSSIHHVSAAQDENREIFYLKTSQKLDISSLYCHRQYLIGFLQKKGFNGSKISIKSIFLAISAISLGSRKFYWIIQSRKLSIVRLMNEIHSVVMH